MCCCWLCSHVCCCVFSSAIPSHGLDAFSMSVSSPVHTYGCRYTKRRGYFRDTRQQHICFLFPWRFISFLLPYMFRSCNVLSPSRGGTIRILMRKADSPVEGMFRHFRACFGIGMHLRSVGNEGTYQTCLLSRVHT